MLLDDFDRWALHRPESVSIRADGCVATYGSLQRMSRGVARVLAAHGVGAGDRVLVYAPKSLTTIASILGVLHLGAAYVPIDPRAPAPRVAQILTAARPRAIIGHVPFLERLSAFDPQLLNIASSVFADARFDGCPILDPNAVACSWDAGHVPSSDDPAYLLYTSGSTGAPKGVVVSHRAAKSFVDWARRTFELGPEDRLTSIAPLSFDLSIFDLFGALSSGALVDLVAPESLLRPAELVGSLARWETSTIYAVPSTITLLEREGQLARVQLPKLRRVLYAGEPFAIGPLHAAMNAVPQARFYNLFGPTETNVCTYHPVEEPPSLDQNQVPIGRGCDHLTVDLLDDAGHPVAPGEEGELCVAGPSVMTEYFGDPEATLAAFYPADRFADGARRYRTGDRAVMDSEGRFWFRGRRDRLVKRRGYRVELGDIEAALSKHPRVREACAIAEAEGTEMRILAYVALEPGTTSSSLILRAHCGSLLPPYMVPDSVQVLAELPRTLTGKLDLQSLRHRELAS